MQCNVKTSCEQIFIDRTIASKASMYVTSVQHVAQSRHCVHQLPLDVYTTAHPKLPADPVASPRPVLNNFSRWPSRLKVPLVKDPLYVLPSFFSRPPSTENIQELLKGPSPYKSDYDRYSWSVRRAPLHVPPRTPFINRDLTPTGGRLGNIPACLTRLLC